MLANDDVQFVAVLEVKKASRSGTLATVIPFVGFFGVGATCAFGGEDVVTFTFRRDSECLHTRGWAYGRREQLQITKVVFFVVAT